MPAKPRPRRGQSEPDAVGSSGGCLVNQTLCCVRGSLSPHRLHAGLLCESPAGDGHTRPLVGFSDQGWIARRRLEPNQQSLHRTARCAGAGVRACPANPRTAGQRPVNLMQTDCRCSSVRLAGLLSPPTRRKTYLLERGRTLGGRKWAPRLPLRPSSSFGLLRAIRMPCDLPSPRAGVLRAV